MSDKTGADKTSEDKTGEDKTSEDNVQFLVWPGSQNLCQTIRCPQDGHAKKDANKVKLHAAVYHSCMVSNVSC